MAMRSAEYAPGYDGHDGPVAIVYLAAQGISNKEREWREKKEDNIGNQETYG